MVSWMWVVAMCRWGSADRTTVLSCFSHLVSHPPPISLRPGITTSHFPRTDLDTATFRHDYTPLARILFSFIGQEAAIVVEGRCCGFGLVLMCRWSPPTGRRC
ncbi:hypothetical protein K438DRAFT_671903 [Mycena galopus ATCC 62051]|nr:hypothetical protein K438DRAFT_671903 [Mycena galopus ATCC 62051]